MLKTFRIATWNSNGLLKRIDEIELFLINEKIDIFLISESHFTKSSFVNLEGYDCYNSLHPANKARGGATIFIKNNIKHYEDVKIETDIFQVSTVNIEMNNHTNFKISAIYCPPRHSISKQEYLQLFNLLGNHFIVGGDFNAKNTYWGSRLTTTKGKELFEAAKSLKCNFHSGNKPTYWPSNSGNIPDLIDFFISKGLPSNHFQVENNDNLSSDHTPVIITISNHVIQKNLSPSLTSTKTNWHLFKYLIDEKISLHCSLKTDSELEDELDSLIEAIQSSAWESTPSTTKSNNRKSYPLEVRELLLMKRKARKKWQSERTSENKTILNRLSNKLKNLLKEMKNKSLSLYLENLSGTKESNYSLWKAAKNFDRPISQIPPLRKNDNSWARSALEKVELFANHLEKTFQPIPQQTNEENTTKHHKMDIQTITPISLRELNDVIKKDLSQKKAPGYDQITAKIMKNLTDKSLKKFLLIINAAIRIRYVPRQWKVAEIIMVQKPGKPPNEVKSYRPISLLPVMSKIFEKLFLKRLQPVLQQRNLIPSHQFGFRASHSTIEQVHRIVDITEKAMENKDVCTAIFLDVAQAFDRVWHQGLLYKLYRDLPNHYYEIFESYLSDRFFRIKQEGEYSMLKPIKAGVPQGSVLGPILYLLYTRDIPVPNTIKMATFADDTAILATGSTYQNATNKLQNALDETEIWFKKWRMQLNEAKSIHIYFTNKKISYIPIYINSKQIPYANTAKYLGMTLDTKMRWKEHVKKKVEEMKIKFRQMYWLIGPNSGVSLSNKILLYLQVIKPIWTYGLQLWGCAKLNQINMIQKMQNKILRTIVKAPWYIRNEDLHRDLGIQTVKEEILSSAQKHAYKLQSHNNLDLNYIYADQRVNRRLKRTIPMDLATLN